MTGHAAVIATIISITSCDSPPITSVYTPANTRIIITIIIKQVRQQTHIDKRGGAVATSRLLFNGNISVADYMPLSSLL